MAAVITRVSNLSVKKSILFARFSASASFVMSEFMILDIGKFRTSKSSLADLSIVLAAIIVSLILWYKTPSGRGAFDWLKLKTPIVGPMFSQLYTTRASRTLSTLLAAGVGILDAIGICRDVTDNVQFNRLWTDMENNVRNGNALSDAVFDSPYVPSYVASMMASGERAGKLPTVMDRVASFTDEELESRVKSVSAMIEPLMILVMGGVVGGVAIAMLLPIFSMSKVISGV